MEKPLKCFMCGKKATHVFFVGEEVKPICNECNELARKSLPTITLLQVLKGGISGKIKKDVSGIVIEFSGVVKPYKCDYCGEYATFLYEFDGDVFYICRKCNNVLSKEYDTTPFLRVFQGGQNG